MKTNAISRREFLRLQQRKRRLSASQGPSKRWVYNFDSVDDFAVLDSPIILEGDYTLEVTIRPNDWTSNLGRRILGTAESLSNRGFLRLNTDSGGAIQFTPEFTPGGPLLYLPMALSNDEEYRILVTKVGSVGTLAELNSGETVINTSFNHPPGTITHIGRHIGNFFQGVIRDVKFNGVTWRIDQPQQAVQLPEPFNPGQGLTPSNGVPLPTTVVDANNFAMIYAPGAQEPQLESGTYLVELDIEITQGSIRARLNNQLNFMNVSAQDRQIVRGVTTIEQSANRFDIQSMAAGTNCVIYDFKAYRLDGTANPMTLVNTNPERWSEIDA